MAGVRPPWPPRLSRRNWARVVAIAAALVVVGAVAVELGIYHSSRTVVLGPGDFGPKILVTVAPGLTGWSNGTTITLQIYEAVPAAFKNPGLHVGNVTPAAQWTNGYDDELLNGTISANVTSFFLSPIFDTLAQEWTALLGPSQGTNFPSLTVEAVKSVSVGGSIELYQYYNDLPFDAFALKVLDVNRSMIGAPATLSWFNGTGIDPLEYSSLTLASLALNLTLLFPGAPQQVVAISTAVSQIPHGGAPPRTSTPASLSAAGDNSSGTSYRYEWSNSTTDTLLRASYLDGNLPLIGAHFSNGADQGGSLIDLGAAVTVLNDSMNLDSVQVFENQTGHISTAMSTAPSFAYGANTSVAGVGNGYNAVPTRISATLGDNLSETLNHTSADVGIQGVEYEFQHFVRTTVEYYSELEVICPRSGNPPSCNVIEISNTPVRATPDGNFTTSGIVYVNTSSGLQIGAGYIPYYADAAISRLLEGASNGTITLQASGSNSSYQGYTVWGLTDGYGSASSVFDRATNAVTAFPLSMGMGLTIAAYHNLSGGVIGSPEAAVVTAVLELIQRMIGMSPAAVSSFESISYFSGGLAGVGVASGFTDAPAIGPGSPYLVAFYESVTPISFTVPSGTFRFYAPMDYLNATGL